LAAALCFAALTPLLSLVTPAWNPGPVIGEAFLLGSVGAPRSHVALSTIATGDELGVPSEESAMPGYRIEHLTAMIWLIGVSIGLFGLFTGLARLARVASASQPMPDGRWTRFGLAD
jgi:hypothetical protein